VSFCKAKSCHGTEIVTRILAPKIFSKLKMISILHCKSCHVGQIVTRFLNKKFLKMVDRVTFLPNCDTILVVLQIFDRYKTQSWHVFGQS